MTKILKLTNFDFWSPTRKKSKVKVARNTDFIRDSTILTLLFKVT